MMVVDLQFVTWEWVDKGTSGTLYTTQKTMRVRYMRRIRATTGKNGTTNNIRVDSVSPGKSQKPSTLGTTTMKTVCHMA